MFSTKDNPIKKKKKTCLKDKINGRKYHFLLTLIFSYAHMAKYVKRPAKQANKQKNS